MESIRGRNVLLVALVSLAACFSCISRNARANFSYPNFSSTSGLNLVGTTFQLGNRLRLTSAQTHQIGGAWTSAKQEVAGGFQTSFAFEVSQPDSNFGADGFAFIVQNDSVTALGTGGSALGFMDIGERFMFTVFGEAPCKLRFPAFDEFFESADVEISIVEIRF